MRKKTLLGLAFLHLFLTAVFMLLAWKAVFDLAPKDIEQWTVWEHIFRFVSVNGLKVLYGPLNFFYEYLDSSKTLLWFGAHILNSSLQALFFYWLYTLLKRNYEKKH